MKLLVKPEQRGRPKRMRGPEHRLDRLDGRTRRAARTQVDGGVDERDPMSAGELVDQLGGQLMHRDGLDTGPDRPLHPLGEVPAEAVVGPKWVAESHDQTIRLHANRRTTSRTRPSASTTVISIGI